MQRLIGLALALVAIAACTSIEPETEVGGAALIGSGSPPPPGSSCAPGCDTRRGYHLVCPSTATPEGAWCPDSDSCAIMDDCQRAQQQLCDQQCGQPCVVVADGPLSCCDCAGAPVDAGPGGGDAGAVGDAGAAGDAGACPDGGVRDGCGVCGGDGSSCAGCDGELGSGVTVDACGVCGGNGTSCLGCDGVANSGLVNDACGVCGGDGRECAGCDGVPNSGLVNDGCGVCGGDGSTCAPPDPPDPPAPAPVYVMSIYFVPADGADGGASVLDGAYGTPASLLAALITTTGFGVGHKLLGMVGLGHSVGHAYVDMFWRDGDGTEHRPNGFPTGQTGGGDARDLLQRGGGGTILRVQPGRMNTTAEADGDIDKRKRNHGRAIIVNLPPPIGFVGVEVSAQLIGRADFILAKPTWDKVVDRIGLHRAATASRYGLMLEPAIKTRQVGEVGGEGAGCTSFAAMCIAYAGTMSRHFFNPAWTRFVTVGERTLASETYSWGSHVRAPWPLANIHDPWFDVPPAFPVTYMAAWTWSVPPDRPLKARNLRTGRSTWTTQTSVTGYWYDPDRMYSWLRATDRDARARGGVDSLGRHWIARTDPIGRYPYIETDARESVPKNTWDSATDPYLHDWWGPNHPFPGPGLAIRLKDSRGCYVRARDESGGPMDSRGAADDRQVRFTADKVALGDGDVITWYSFLDYPVTAEGGGGGEVTHNRRDVGPWERWTLRKIGANGQPVAGAIAGGDRVALQASTGHWLVAEEGGCGALHADRAAIGPWEIFTIATN